MVPVVPLIVGCVFLVLLAVAVYAYRIRVQVHVSGGSDDEDEDEEFASENRARVAAETAALMDSDDDSLPLAQARRRSVPTDDRSRFGCLGYFFRPIKSKPKTSVLMHRRTKGVKKIHKPYFYPLLDETAQWFADWETKKQQACEPVSEIIEVRIDKPPQDATALSACDLLDSLDCVSLVSFRSTSHTIIPVTAN